MSPHEPNTVDKTNTHHIVDLFSGVGGLSLGSARAGMVVRGAIDNDPEAIRAHGQNFPDAVHLNADISRLTGQTLRQRLYINEEEISGIIGGPPCQGFSTIGKKDRQDSRNRLFVDFFRIVSEVLPKFFLAENVPGILKDSYIEVRERAYSLVEKKYSLLPIMEFTASNYGAATVRKRIFFIGYLPDVVEQLTEESFEVPVGVERVYVKDALRGLPTKIDPNWQREDQSWQVVQVHGNSNFAKRLHGYIPPGVGDQNALKRLKENSEASGFLGTVHSPKVAERYGNTKRGKYDSISKSYRLNPDGFCPTLRAGTGPDQGSFQAVRPIHPTESRVITPREAARLQGFPDWYQFSPTKWHSFRQIGNSVSPNVAEHILSVVSKALGVTNCLEENHG